MTESDLSTEIRRELQVIADGARSLEATVQLLARMQGANTRAEEAEHAPRAASDTAAAAGTMHVTDGQRRICERVINVFETGTVEGKDGAISIYRDGPGRIRQITYGRSQTTEYSNLRELVQMYVDAGGSFSAGLAPYVAQIGRIETPLVDNATFKDLLRRAGNEDPVMRQTQDTFFDTRYFQPALSWANANAFTYPLSMLVIYDFFIHSGSIRSELRGLFPERPPAQGGNEETWISQYVAVRHAWLTNHSNPAVRPSNYRTRDLGREIAAGNWNLEILPIMANGVPVDDTPAVEAAGIRARTPGTPAADASYSGEEDWCEAEPPARVGLQMAAADETPAGLAGQILNHQSIGLATAHVSGVNDNATARQNIIDTAAGQPARRSSYDNAPGGSVALDPNMLRGLLALAETYSFHVSELCGASHSVNSRHYRGTTADFNFINGQHIGASHPHQAAFRARCQAFGATQVLGPGNSGHATHIHAAWPNPS